jgi:hypothetical protein
MVRKIFQQPIAANVTAPVRDIGRSAMARVLLAIIGSGVIVLATVRDAVRDRKELRGARRKNRITTPIFGGTWMPWPNASASRNRRFPNE